MNYKMCIKKEPTTLLSMFALLVLLLAACSQAENGKGNKTEIVEDTVKISPYETTPVRLMNPQYEISLPAELEPYEQVALYAKVKGFVKHLYVDRGDKVRKGQLLAVLEAPEMNQQYLSNKATEQKLYSDYVYARQAYDRLLAASATAGAVAAIELDRAKSATGSAKSAYKASQAEARQASQMQDYLRITAPFDGVITERNVSVGVLVGTSSAIPIFRMAQGNKLRLTLSLPEKHAASVRNGMNATFTINSQPGQTFTATLSRTSELIDQQDRSLKLEFDVDNGSGQLRGGNYAQVKLKLQRKTPTYWVSGKNILNTQMGAFVFTLKDHEIKRIPVKEGVRLDTLTEVFGDLSPKDSVIVKPTAETKEGAN